MHLPSRLQDFQAVRKEAIRNVAWKTHMPKHAYIHTYIHTYIHIYVHCSISKVCCKPRSGTPPSSTSSLLTGSFPIMCSGKCSQGWRMNRWMWHGSHLHCDVRVRMRVCVCVCVDIIKSKDAYIRYVHACKGPWSVYSKLLFSGVQPHKL